MRKLIAVLALAALLVTAAVAFATNAVAGGSGAHAAAATKTVTIGDNFFKPKTLKVKKGTFVQWVWGPDNSGTVVEHNVTGAKGNRFASHDETKPDKPYKRKITKTTTVICTIHPTTMKMTIKVVK
jgi:plastocyanin